MSGSDDDASEGLGNREQAGGMVRLAWDSEADEDLGEDLEEDLDLSDEIENWKEGSWNRPKDWNKPRSPTKLKKLALELQTPAEKKGGRSKACVRSSRSSTKAQEAEKWKKVPPKLQLFKPLYQKKLDITNGDDGHSSQDDKENFNSRKTFTQVVKASRKKAVTDNAKRRVKVCARVCVCVRACERERHENEIHGARQQIQIVQEKKLLKGKKVTLEIQLQWQDKLVKAGMKTTNLDSMMRKIRKWENFHNAKKHVRPSAGRPQTITDEVIQRCDGLIAKWDDAFRSDALTLTRSVLSLPRPIRALLNMLF